MDVCLLLGIFFILAFNYERCALMHFGTFSHRHAFMNVVESQCVMLIGVGRVGLALQNTVITFFIEYKLSL